LGAQQGKLDADLRTSALLGTPSVQSVHDYYPFALEDGSRLAPMAAELVDRLAILVAVRRFHGMGPWGPLTLVPCSYVRMQHFVRRSTSVPFRRFLGDVRREYVNSCNAFLLLFMALWVLISATLVRRAVLVLWHAFMFLGLRFFPPFFFFRLVASTAFNKFSEIHSGAGNASTCSDVQIPAKLVCPVDMDSPIVKIL
jgi:hypothetical protein